MCHGLEETQCCQIFSQELSYKRSKIIVFGPKLSYFEFFTLFSHKFQKIDMAKKMVCPVQIIISEKLR